MLPVSGAEGVNVAAALLVVTVPGTPEIAKFDVVTVAGSIEALNVAVITVLGLTLLAEFPGVTDSKDRVGLFEEVEFDDEPPLPPAPQEASINRLTKIMTPSIASSV